MTDQDHQRLSDRIFKALELSIEQKDTIIADKLVEAMEMTMTRRTGGSGFEERRNYPAKVEAALDKLAELKAAERL